MPASDARPSYDDLAALVREIAATLPICRHGCPRDPREGAYVVTDWACENMTACHALLRAHALAAKLEKETT